MRKQGQNGLARARKRPNLVAASRIAKQRCVGYWNRHLFSVALKKNGYQAVYNIGNWTKFLD